MSSDVITDAYIQRRIVHYILVTISIMNLPCRKLDEEMRAAEEHVKSKGLPEAGSQRAALRAEE